VAGAFAVYFALPALERARRSLTRPGDAVPL